jgi:hypothetical protein
MQWLYAGFYHLYGHHATVPDIGQKQQTVLGVYAKIFKFKHRRAF